MKRNRHVIFYCCEINKFGNIKTSRLTVMAKNEREGERKTERGRRILSALSKDVSLFSFEIESCFSRYKKQETKRFAF